MPEISAGMRVKSLYKVGDKIRVGEESGIVEDIQPMYLRLKTRNAMVSIPNSRIAQEIVETPRKKVD